MSLASDIQRYKELKETIKIAEKEVSVLKERIFKLVEITYTTRSGITVKVIDCERTVAIASDKAREILDEETFKKIYRVSKYQMLDVRKE